VNLRQYTTEGTIQAFLPHLSRISEMGVDVIWLMPIHPTGIVNRKGSLGSYYSSRNFKEVNPEYGTKSDFKELVDRAHELGMRVILDWVANHAAWDNNWTIDHPDYFVRDENGIFLSPYDWTDVIQIDHNNESAHDAMREAMCYWIKEFDIDGFRADLAHLTPLRFWLKAREMADSLKPGLIWLAETEDAPYYQAFDIFYAWKWMHKSEMYCKENHHVHTLVSTIKETIHQYPEGALQMYFTANHDENSWNGTEYEKYGIFSEALAVFSFYYPFSVPLIYSGQELPNTRRLSFFDKDQIDWTDDCKLAHFYSTLTHHRKKIPTTNHIEFINLNEKILAFQRGQGSGAVLVFLNLDHHKHTISFSLFDVCVKNIFSGEIKNEASLNLHLEPGGYQIWEIV
jgi:glycosidase